MNKYSYNARESHSFYSNNICSYTPIRSDSVVGELRLSKPTDIILPGVSFLQYMSALKISFSASFVLIMCISVAEIPRIQMLILTGKAIERETITAVEVIPDTESQHRVWEKYKNGITYQW